MVIKGRELRGAMTERCRWRDKKGRRDRGTIKERENIL